MSLPAELLLPCTELQKQAEELVRESMPASCRDSALFTPTHCSLQGYNVTESSSCRSTASCWTRCVDTCARLPFVAARTNVDAEPLPTTCRYTLPVDKKIFVRQATSQCAI